MKFDSGTPSVFFLKSHFLEVQGTCKNDIIYKVTSKLLSQEWSLAQKIIFDKSVYDNNN